MSNPKDRIGVTKVPLGIFPPAALAHAAVAMHDGASKYGRWNWRGEKVAASVYIDACMRHLLDWYHGEEEAEDSGAHHLGHAIACLAIILDAQGTENLIDDRPAVDQNCSEIFAQLSEKIKRINGLREPAQNITRDQVAADTQPKQWIYQSTLDSLAGKVDENAAKGCCAPSTFVDEARAALDRDPRITKTECILGHEVATIDESHGYIDGEYKQGTAFRCTVARWRKGFETIDDEMENHYATTNSE